MFIKPSHFENVVVLTKVKSNLKYFITTKELWILNGTLLKEAFEKQGYFVPEDKSERRFFEVLDESNIIFFLPLIEKYTVDIKELEQTG